MGLRNGKLLFGSYPNLADRDDCDDDNTEESNNRKRKFQYNLIANTIHIMRTWFLAHKLARESYCEIVARKRIKLSKWIEPISNEISNAPRKYLNNERVNLVFENLGSESDSSSSSESSFSDSLSDNCDSGQGSGASSYDSSDYSHNSSAYDSASDSGNTSDSSTSASSASSNNLSERQSNSSWSSSSSSDSDIEPVVHICNECRLNNNDIEK